MADSRVERVPEGAEASPRGVGRFVLAVMIGVVVALLLALAWFYLSSRNRPVMRTSEKGAYRLQESSASAASAAPVIAALPPAYTGVMMPPTA